MNTDTPPKSIAGQPVVTFILIAYNQPELLQASIETIRAQTGEIPFETIVVDTGSRLPAKNWLAGQTDILSIFSHHRQRSLGSQIELALTAAQGTYLCFLGNGALLYPQTVQTALQVFSGHSGRHPLGAVGFLTREIGSENRFGHYQITSDQFQPAPLLQAGLIKKTALNDVGISGSPVFQDLDQTMRLIQAGYELRIAEGAYAETAPYPIIDSWVPKFALIKEEANQFLKQYNSLFNPSVTKRLDWQQSLKQPQNLSAEEKPRTTNLCLTPILTRRTSALKRKLIIQEVGKP